MKILSIETSCDDTGISLVEITEDKKRRQKIKILKELVSSQVKIHAPFGGVVPSLAKREHQKNLPVLLGRILNNESRRKGKKFILHNSNSIIQSIDLIAVTVGPGLEPALWTGIEFAKDLAKKWGKPLVGVNHLHGHMYSFLLAQKAINQNGKSKSKNIQTSSFKLQDTFPAIVLLVSGGHTILAVMKNLNEYKKLGETVDDAVGESFDKVARLLDLPYPGGPEVEKFAKKGDSRAIAFPSPMIHQKNYNFSYSGLKTAVLYYVRDHRESTKEDIAASFQNAAFVPLVSKTMRAVEEYGAKAIIVGGGVAANKELSRLLRSKIKNLKLKINLIVPPFRYCMDNATMIALAGYMRAVQNKKYPLKANGVLDI